MTIFFCVFVYVVMIVIVGLFYGEEPFKFDVVEAAGLGLIWPYSYCVLILPTHVKRVWKGISEAKDAIAGEVEDG